ncbi:MAG: radical SAM protein [Prevotella sp.]|nr:radical SAM protein [Prevotella sp.]
MENITDSSLAVSFLPTTAILEITGACNHRCIFCSCPWEAAKFNGFESKSELSVGEWKTLIDMLCERGVNNIVFSGGEALLRKGIFEIIEYAASKTVTRIETENGQLIREEKPLKLYLISNGTAITKKILAFLQRHHVQLSISLPGLSTLKEHTGSGNPDHILSKFRMAHEMGMYTVVNVTVTKKNLFELYHILSAAFLAGADQLLLNRFLPGGRGLSYEKELMLNVHEVRQMLDIAEEALTDAGRFGDIGTELPKCIVDKEKYKQLSIGTRCSAAIGFFVISPDGFVRVCNHSTVKLEHFTQMDMLPNHPYWKKFTMKDYLPASCIHCSQMGDCDGGCREAAHIYNGAIDSLDPLLK